MVVYCNLIVYLLSFVVNYLISYHFAHVVFKFLPCVSSSCFFWFLFIAFVFVCFSLIDTSLHLESASNVGATGQERTGYNHSGMVKIMPTLRRGGGSWPGRDHLTTHVTPLRMSLCLIALLRSMLSSLASQMLPHSLASRQT